LSVARRRPGQSRHDDRQHRRSRPPTAPPGPPAKDPPCCRASSSAAHSGGRGQHDRPVRPNVRAVIAACRQGTHNVDIGNELTGVRASWTGMSRQLLTATIVTGASFGVLATRASHCARASGVRHRPGPGRRDPVARARPDHRELTRSNVATSISPSRSAIDQTGLPRCCSRHHGRTAGDHLTTAAMAVHSARCRSCGREKPSASGALASL
jgi:hypothetical protein